MQYAMLYAGVEKEMAADCCCWHLVVACVVLFMPSLLLIAFLMLQHSLL
jgi:hypothetical protein